ncbi:secretin [Deinococcus detaillensis]|uniref:Secretin n=1 Tax=Deinococcus detaillensis TaxID=2592048 RepID=A0A553V6E2_9DEIO|nr:secretin N-terminal domain-containing protein [Deinococcus detaillensis]TSA88043.1 secretin [Deinococcus detaillensis]
MKNRSLILLLTLALSAASAQSAQTGNAVSADTRLSKANVTFKIVRDGTGLMALLTAVAKSAGYELILDPALDSLIIPGVGSGSGVPSDAATPQAAQPGVSATQLTYDFASKPFNQVWPFLMDVYGLNYDVVKLGSSEVLRVGKNPIQRIVVLPKTLDASLVGERVKLAFGTRQTSAPVTATPGSPAPQTAGGDIVLDSPTLKIVGEPVSNSLIIRGNNQEVSQVEALVKEIIASQPPELAKVVVPVSPVIQSIYNVKGAQDDAVALIKDQYPGLAVTAVGKTGQLILSGQKTQIDAALTLLTQVDRAPSVQQNPDVRQQVYGVKGSQKDIAALLTAQFPALKITPVGTTGQLVLNGTQDQLSAASTLLGQVDKAIAVSNGPEIQQKVFQLVNASAESVKAVLEGSLARDLTTQTSGSQLQNNAAVSAAALSGLTPTQARQAQAAQATAPAPTTAANPASPEPDTAAVAPATPDATIIADKRTNTLIVRGTAQQVAQIAELIPSLDQRVPQVNVQVRIQEITDTAMRALGVNWKAGFGGFSLGIAPGSDGNSALTAAFDPTRALVGGFNILPTLTAMESQGQTKRVYDGSVSMQSGQRNLTNTSVTQNAAAGAAALVRSGGTLEINRVGTGGSESIQKTYPYGVTLGFYDPQVAPDGTITVRVRGEVSAQPTLSSNAAGDFLLTSSEAQSTISFKNGETVLLSGLLGTNETSNKSGVPFLSSIPVVGGAFGNQSSKKDQVQLMVVITGTVIK